MAQPGSTAQATIPTTPLSAPKLDANAVANGGGVSAQPHLSEPIDPPKMDPVNNGTTAAAADSGHPESTLDPNSASQTAAQNEDGAKKRNTSFKITNILPSRPPSNDPEESGGDGIEDSRTGDVSDNVDPSVGPSQALPQSVPTAAAAAASTQAQSLIPDKPKIPPQAVTVASLPLNNNVNAIPEVADSENPVVVNSVPSTANPASVLTDPGNNSGVRRNSSTKSQSKPNGPTKMLCYGYRFNIFVNSKKQGSGNEPLRPPAAQVRASSAAAYVSVIDDEGTDDTDNTAAEPPNFLSVIKDEAFPKHGPRDRFKVVKIQTAASKSIDRWTLVDYGNRSGPLAPPPPAFPTGTSDGPKLPLKPVLKPSKDIDTPQTPTGCAMPPPATPHQSFAQSAQTSIPSSVVIQNDVGEKTSIADLVPITEKEDIKMSTILGANMEHTRVVAVAGVPPPPPNSVTASATVDPVHVPSHLQHSVMTTSSSSTAGAVLSQEPSTAAAVSTHPQPVIHQPLEAAAAAAAVAASAAAARLHHQQGSQQLANSAAAAAAADAAVAAAAVAQQKAIQATSQQPQLQVTSVQSMPAHVQPYPQQEQQHIAQQQVQVTPGALAEQPSYVPVTIPPQTVAISLATNSVPPSQVTDRHIPEVLEQPQVSGSAGSAVGNAVGGTADSNVPTRGGTLGRSASLVPSWPPIVGELLVERLEEISAQRGAQGGVPDPDSASGTNQGAIDNRIEQAMDLVKSHLMNAVRSEVEDLKEKIIKLEDNLSNLQRENEVLKQNVPSEVLAQLQLSHNSSVATNQQPALAVSPSAPAAIPVIPAVQAVAATPTPINQAPALPAPTMQQQQPQAAAASPGSASSSGPANPPSAASSAPVSATHSSTTTQ